MLQNENNLGVQGLRAFTCAAFSPFESKPGVFSFDAGDSAAIMLNNKYFRESEQGPSAVPLELYCCSIAKRK